jgi:2-oxoglutarate ferredoxin oxidoreductase subunit delta
VSAKKPAKLANADAGLDAPDRGGGGGSAKPNTVIVERAAANCKIAKAQTLHALKHSKAVRFVPSAAAACGGKTVNHEGNCHMENRLQKRLGKVCTGHVWANTKLCKACWDCVGACPRQVVGRVSFLWHRHIVFIAPGNCTGCKKCVEPCRHGVFSEDPPDALKGILQRLGVRV